MYATMLAVHNGDTYIYFTNNLQDAITGLLRSGFWNVDERSMWFRHWVSGNDITDAHIKQVELCVADKYELTIKAVDVGRQRVFKKRFPTKRDAMCWVETCIRDPRWEKYNISIVEERFVP